MISLFFGNEEISCTPDHRFYIPKTKKYIPADSLRRGMQVLTLAVGLLTLDSVTYADTTFEAHNFEVENYHNYFVGDQAILVHNDYRVRAANISDAEFDDVFHISIILQREYIQCLNS